MESHFKLAIFVFIDEIRLLYLLYRMTKMSSGCYDMTKWFEIRFSLGILYDIMTIIYPIKMLSISIFAPQNFKQWLFNVV